MDPKEILNIYRSTPYEKIEADDSNKTRQKFNSVTHYLSYMEDLDSRFARKAQLSTSNSNNDGGFNLTASLKDAFSTIRKVKFNPDSIKDANNFIRKTRKVSKFSGEGNEIDIPEFISGAEKHWLDDTDKKVRFRILDTPLFINIVYAGHYRADQMQNAGLDLLNSIYKTGVIPKNLTMVLHTDVSANSVNDHLVMIEMSFNDLHGFAKALHPDFFRRVYFRSLETIHDLQFGYGRPREYATAKGTMQLYRYADMSREDKDRAVRTFLGIK